MAPTDYNLSDQSFLALCIWRESSNQPFDAMRGVGHVVNNRASKPSWWGNSIQSVIMKPWQFSSFPVLKDGKNINPDPNCNRWPHDSDPSWTQALSASTAILTGNDLDLTDGATHYYDSSISWPKAWGNQAEYVNTVNIGRLHFWKMKPTNHDSVSDAATGEN